MANILIKQGLEIAVPDFVITTDEARKVDLTSIIQTGTTASQAITAGTYFYLNGTLVRAKVDIANGATFTLNTNYEVVTAGALNELVVKYSGSERVIGTWIDGSLLYEKTIDFGALPNATLKDVAHNISNLKKIVSLNGAATDSNGAAYPLPFAHTSTIANNIDLRVTSGNIRIIAGVNYSSFYGYVTLRYTKSS